MKESILVVVFIFFDFYVIVLLKFTMNFGFLSLTFYDRSISEREVTSLTLFSVSEPERTNSLFLSAPASLPNI